MAGIAYSADDIAADLLDSLISAKNAAAEQNLTGMPALACNLANLEQSVRGIAERIAAAR